MHFSRMLSCLIEFIFCDVNMSPFFLAKSHFPFAASFQLVVKVCATLCPNSTNSTMSSATGLFPCPKSSARARLDFILSRFPSTWFGDNCHFHFPYILYHFYYPRVFGEKTWHVEPEHASRAGNQPCADALSRSPPFGYLLLSLSLSCSHISSDFLWSSVCTSSQRRIVNWMDVAEFCFHIIWHGNVSQLKTLHGRKCYSDLPMDAARATQYRICFFTNRPVGSVGHFASKSCIRCATKNR